jgi:hypothetical protein
LGLKNVGESSFITPSWPGIIIESVSFVIDEVLQEHSDLTSSGIPK